MNPDALLRDAERKRGQTSTSRTHRVRARTRGVIVPDSNRTRMDFVEKFEKLIDAYNAGSGNIDQLFRELLSFSRSLSEEESRHVRENLTEEELTVFDLLTRPGPGLPPAYSPEVFRQKCGVVFEHVYEKFPDGAGPDQ